MGKSLCPLCQKTDSHLICDFGDMPLVNSINDSTGKYPLRLYFCRDCGLVYINTPKTPENIFSNYTYFSSWSETWLKHCRKLFFDISENEQINKNSFIIEIASNDGYMLNNFIEDGFTDVLGIEPASNVAKAAAENGIPTINKFFSSELASELSAHKKADCVIALNVLAHVPDINDFLSGIRLMLSNGGFAVFEFHHLKSLLESVQYDTIYHEHYSYLSLHTVSAALSANGLRVFNAERIPTQGGSLRVHASLNSAFAKSKYPVHNNVAKTLSEENKTEINSLDIYKEFADNVEKSIRTAGKTLGKIRQAGSRIAGYGAAAKSVIFINSLELDTDTINCVADINPVKQGTLIPGTIIPVVSPDELISYNPDYVIIFPWNLRDEITASLREKLPAETKFIVFTPEVEIFR